MLNDQLINTLANIFILFILNDFFMAPYQHALKSSTISAFREVALKYCSLNSKMFMFRGFPQSVSSRKSYFTNS